MSTIGVTVPRWFKQSLTTLQITQFVVGATYAFAHLFVAYQIPVSVPYLYRLGTAASTVLNSVPSDVSSAASVAVSTASAGAGAGAWLKKIALRAAGHEGLAENVLNEQGRPFGIDAVHIAEDLVAKEETRYRDEMQWVNCLDTSGQVFAILLNCLYLLPLTWLFAQFFITSYLKRVERRRSSTASEMATTARLSLRDASKGVARRLSEAVEEMHSTAGDIGDDAVLVDGDEIKRELREAIQQAKSRIGQGAAKAKNSASAPDAEKVRQEVQRDLEKVRKNVQGAADKVVAAVTEKDKQEQVKVKAQTVKDTVAEAVKAAVENVKPAAEKAVETTKSAGNQAAETAKSASEKADEPQGGGDSSASDKAEASAEGQNGEGKTEKSTSSSEQQDSPNENGTGVEGATGDREKASTSEGKKKDTNGAPGTPSGSKKKNKKNKKKAEDKTIDESKIVRDEDVDTNTGAGDNKEAEENKDDSNESKAEAEGTSEVKEGTTFADAVKE